MSATFETELLESGVQDFGGTANSPMMEIEYVDFGGNHVEAIYRIPQELWNYEMTKSGIKDQTILFFTLGAKNFEIFLKGKCSQLLEVRKPIEFGGEEITSIFFEGTK